MKMKQDNRGVSMVELLVIIGILSIMVGVGGYSLSLLFGKQASECAQNVSGILNETKTACLSRYDETMTLTYLTKGTVVGGTTIQENGYYTINQGYTIKKDTSASVPKIEMIGTGDPQVRRVGGRNVKITLTFSDGDVKILRNGLPEADKIEKVLISYKRSNGAFDYVTVDGVETTKYIKRIEFANGASTYTIVMVPETGKHSYE